MSALVRVTARQQSQLAVTVRCWTRVTVEARGSHSTQVTLYVFVAPPATHGLDSGPGSRGVQGPRRGRPTLVRPAPARAEGVEVVAPAAPSAPPLESDGYPRRKQPVHPNRYIRKFFYEFNSNK